MSRSILATVLMVLALLAGACASDDTTPADVGDEVDGDIVEPGETVDDSDMFTVDVDLTGDAEVPGPGSDGTGTATFTIDGPQACLEGELDGVGPIVAGHVHTGTADEAGGVLLDLATTTDGDGPFDTCVDVDEATATEITEDPAGYYVNLHTEEFPDGAVRGQLG
ncbi:hypothetical protein BH23ACT9_BH23ACT9_17010 [soil metagenome]